MKYAVDAQTMSAIDQYAINNVGIPSLVLMEKAAMKIVDRIAKKHDKSERILAVCGTGNNGGDGVASARMLHELGYSVDVYLVGSETRASEQMKVQLNIIGNLGMSMFNSAKISEYTVIIDALFGVGLARDIEGKYADVIEEINASGAVVWAVDLPSGINGSNGKKLGTAVKADYTVTFGYHKLGLILYPGCEYAGDVEVVDIGFPKQAIGHVHPQAFYYEPSDIQKMPQRKKRSNKGTFGRVLVIAGSKNMSGAAYLSAKAAYRTGAGLVKILTDDSNRATLQSMLPEAILSTYQSDCFDTQMIQRELDWATVVVLGPGIGTSENTQKLVSFVTANIKIPLILDADAINLLADDEKYVIKNKIDQNAKLHLPSNVILTPHLKEMSRLIKLPLHHIVSDIFTVASEYRGEYVLVLKDARTIVVNEDQMYLNVSGNNGMATAGSGDVLTGVIAGLVAQGMGNFDAATMGVYLHGIAGDYATKEKNCYSVMASDIIDALSYIM